MSHRYASGKRDIHSTLLKRCYDVDVHIISGKPVVPLKCQTFEIGENIDWEFVYQNSNNGYQVAAWSEVSTLETTHKHRGTCCFDAKPPGVKASKGLSSAT